MLDFLFKGAIFDEVMPFGTKEIADTSKELSDQVKEMNKNMDNLSKTTQGLADTCQQFKSSTDNLQQSMTSFGNTTSQLTTEMNGFRQDMRSFTDEMVKLRGSLDKTSDVLAIQISNLASVLQDFGKHMTRSMVDNIREEASNSLSKIFPLGKKRD